MVGRFKDFTLVNLIYRVLPAKRVPKLINVLQMFRSKSFAAVRPAAGT